MSTINYVAGFLFDRPGQRVALIEKLKPEWQAGKLNAIGGKIEDSDATPLHAMIREFQEETGAVVTDWRLFCTLHFRGAVIHFFETAGDLFALKSMEEEQVKIVSVAEIGALPTIRNLRWLVPMALDDDQVAADVQDPS